MKIIEFIFRLGAGGAEVFVANLSNALYKKGNEVIIITLFKDREGAKLVYEPLLDKNIQLHQFNFDLGFSMAKVKKVCDYVKGVNPDVIHCHLNVIPYIYPIALCNKKIRIFHTIHSLANNLGTKGLTKALARFFYKSGKICPITISRQCKESFEKYYNLSGVPVIDNGCADAQKSILFNDVQKEVSSYKNNDKTPVFIHVARCHPLKRQDRLIAAFNKLNDEGIDFVLLVLGRGFDSEESESYVSTACDKIHFLGQKSDVADYLFCSDAFCLTSEVEGLPISLIEALSAEVCPICTPVGGMLDVIQNGENGYLSDTEDVDDYCKAIKRYLLNPIDRDALLLTFRNKYSMDICCDRYIQLMMK